MLTTHFDEPELHRLNVYEGKGGYVGLRRAVTEMKGPEILDEIKASGLRGRSSNFPAGVKWSLVPMDHPGPKYVVVNADESEPGCTKDRFIMERSPHAVIEGALIAARCIGANQVWIYVRGEYDRSRRMLEDAVAELRAAGHLGPRPFGSDHPLDVQLFSGHGAYICGEETALLESMEGKRGQPRSKPPFPAVKGLWGKPTLVSNVETFAVVAWILANGAAAYTKFGTEKSRGSRLFTVSGHIQRPGNYEMELGTPMSKLINDWAGGPFPGRRIKCWWPGGSSFPVLTEAHLDVGSDIEALQAAGTMGGSGGVIILDDSACVFEAAARLIKFYARESCGKCTPCRTGGDWASRTFDRILAGQGTAADLDTFDRIQESLQGGRCLCVLGDSAGMVIQSTMKHFRDEYEEHCLRNECSAKGVKLVAGA